MISGSHLRTTRLYVPSVAERLWGSRAFRPSGSAEGAQTLAEEDRADSEPEHDEYVSLVTHETCPRVSKHPLRT